MGNGWVYPLRGAVILARWGLIGLTMIAPAGINALLLHGIYPIIKRAFVRRRPFQAAPELPSLLDALDTHSFPSGHMMTMAGVLTPIVMLWADFDFLGRPHGGLRRLVAGGDSASLPERRARRRFSVSESAIPRRPALSPYGGCASPFAIRRIVKGPVSWVTRRFFRKTDFRFFARRHTKASSRPAHDGNFWQSSRFPYVCKAYAR